MAARATRFGRCAVERRARAPWHRLTRARFAQALPGGKGPIAPASAGGADDAPEDVGPGTRALYKLSDASGKLVFTKLAEGNLDRKLVTSSDAFVVDAGAEVFVYLGKQASAQEKVSGPQHARRVEPMANDGGRRPRPSMRWISSARTTSPPTCR